MDLVAACKELIRDAFNELERQPDPESEGTTDEFAEGSSFETTQQSWSGYGEPATDSDRNLNKILNQQAFLKRIIDQDNHMQMLTSSLKTIQLQIEGLRKECTRANEEALKNRQELVQAQAKEVERFQMNQLRSISEDHARHQDILEQRKKEIISLKKEIEREEQGREAYLFDVERKMQEKIAERQKSIGNGNLPFGPMTSGTSLNDELHNPDHLELTSVDEYAPYGEAPHSRVSARGGGRARGGRGGRARRGRSGRS